LVCLIIFISSVIYPLTINDLFHSFTEHLGNQAPEITNQLEQQKTALIVILVLWQIGFISLAFISCIFMTHKVAGPMYKVQQYLATIRDGDFNGKLFFRNGDYFHEVAEDLNETFETIQENYKNDFVYLSEVNAYLNNLSLVVPDDKKVVLKEITHKLSEIQSRFQPQDEE
jgi:signal transduction histidine kinase